MLALLALLAVPAAAPARCCAGAGPPGRPPRPGSPSAAGAGHARGGGARSCVGADADRARADAHAAWDELLDTLVDFRVRVDPTETPRATADRLVRDALDRRRRRGRRPGCWAGPRSGPGTPGTR